MLQQKEKLQGKLSSTHFTFMRRLGKNRGCSTFRGSSQHEPQAQPRKHLPRTRYQERRSTGRNAQEGLIHNSRDATPFRRFLVVTPDEGFNFKQVPQGRASFPVLLPLFIRLEFENIHRLLTMNYRLCLCASASSWAISARLKSSLRHSSPRSRPILTLG